MAAQPRDGSATRADLLRATIEHLAHHGVGEVSLRTLATALGTSHRMLIYHFGSRDGLLVEVVRAVEEQQRAAFDDLRRELAGATPPASTAGVSAAGAPAAVTATATVPTSTGTGTGQPDPTAEPASVAVARRMWRRLSDPALAPYERLFFELYGQALQGRPYAVPLLAGIVDSWLGPLTEFFEADGLPPETARAQARVALATTRGLLLDLLATGDRAGVDAAVEQAIAGYGPRPAAG